VKRKLLLWMVLFAAWVYGSVLLAPEANAADNPCGLAGGGVPGNPYEISNADQLQCLSQFQSGYLSGHFKLTSNIIMTGRTWNPIGDYANPFAGVFDGNGFRIVGLTVSGGANTGMFGFINGGTIKNLGLEDVQVSSNGNGVGGLAGSITNGRIESSYVTGSVSGVDYVGGLAGLLDQSIVEDSYAMVNVSSTFEAGGLVAYITGNSTISDSYVIGTLLANHRSGGIAAQISSSVVVTKTYTVVNILGNPGIYGMLVASNQGGDVSDSYWSGAGDAVGDNKGRVENVWELSESQLKQKSSFGAFDFDNKWAIMEGISYPYLKHSANLSITTPTSPFTYLASGQNVSINGTLSWGVLDSPLRILYMVTDANNVALKEGQLASAASIFSVSQNIGPLPIGKYNLWIWGLWASKGTEPHRIELHAVPDAPGGLQAEAGDRSVTLTWNGVTGADSYTVYVYQGETEPEDEQLWQIAQANVTGTSHTVTGLTYGETYWFKVSAVAQGMEGAVTDKVSAVPKIAVASVEEFADLTVPYGTPLHEAGLPANVQVTLVNNETKSVPVSWDNGDPVYDETKPGTYTFTGTLAWPDYVIQPASPTTIRVHVQPAAPENLIAEAGDRKVTLTWGAVKNADSYKIYMAKREQEPDAGDWRLEADNIEDTTYTVTGLTYGETYWFKVSAVAQGMEGAVTDKVSAVPKIAVASVGEMPDILVPNGTLLSEKDLPSEVEITLADDVTLHVAVKWDKSTFPLDWTIPGAYTLYGTLDLPSQLHVINPNDLKAKVRVLVRPAAPGSLQAIAGDRQVTLMWGAVPGGENATVTYTVYKYQGDYESLPIDLKDWQMVAMGIKDTFYTVEGLDYGKTYWFKVQAKAHGLEGTVTPTVSAVPWVPVKSVETLADITVQHGTAWNNLGLPDRVQVTLADYSTTMADVDWSSNPPYDGNTPGTYTFTGTLDLPDYINNDEAQLKAEVRVTVLNPPDSDSSSGGGPSVQSKVIEAKLETAFGKEVAVNIVIIRTWENGIVRDRVTLTPESMQEAWQTILENGGNFARVILPDEQDEVTEVDFRIVAETIRQLREAKVDLEIFTENVRVRIPASSLAGVEEDVSFKLVPVREKVKRQELEERARANQAVITIARGQSVEVLGRPVTIETNLQNRPVTLILPLTGVELPGEPAAREDYLADLAVYIEHSDGSREVVTPQVVEYKLGIFWLQFTVNKFSAFVILKIDGLREKAEGNSHKAYMKGYADGTFRPDRTVTRAEMAAILARNLGFDGAGNGGGSFADVKSTHWAVKEIEFVKDSGLMVGDGHGHFRPDAPITRGEMAAIAARFKQLDTSGYVKSSFSDVEESYWAFASMEAAKAAGIIDGYTDGTFRPHGPLTRAEAVKIINRMFERGPLHGVTVPSWPDVPASHWAFAEIEEASRDHHYTVLSDGGEQVSE